MPRLLMLTLLACLTLSPAIRSADAEGPGVVFHLDSESSMNRMLAQVARHHTFNPDIETRVILIGNGVKPALEGAEDANGGQYSAQMEQLMASGIRIFACEATLNYYNLTEDDLACGVETVPSGSPHSEGCRRVRVGVTSSSDESHIAHARFCRTDYRRNLDAVACRA